MSEFALWTRGSVSERNKKLLGHFQFARTFLNQTCLAFIALFSQIKIPVKYRCLLMILKRFEGCICRETKYFP